MQAHWLSMFAYVTGVLGAQLSTYFQIVPGVHKSSWGLNDCAGGRGNMNSASCAGSGWQAADGGAWWIRGWPYNQPDGDYRPDTYLSMAASSGSPVDETALGIQFNDHTHSEPYPYSGPYYICSTNDV